MAYPVVDDEKCVGCGECVDNCPNDVLEMDAEKAKVVAPDECVECESCIEVCESGAITLTE